MSEIATEAIGAPQPITTLEFLGSTTDDRITALRQAAAFQEMTKRALVDSLEVHTGETVSMRCFPSRTLLPQYNTWVPCYSLMDEDRQPVELEAKLLGVNQQSFSVRVGAGEQQDGRYQREWIVGIGKILSLQVIEQGPEEK